MRHIIVGGVAGGATAAARIRRNSERDEIILFEKGSYISYANCGLPYYIGGQIADRDKLFVQTPEAFSRRFNIDLRINSEVVAIDPEAKTVSVRTAEGKEYVENYDRLLLSPGASPVRPPLPGIDMKGIFTLRNVEDTDAVKNYISAWSPATALIIGAGFIGLEMAENLHDAGLQVGIVEMADQVMAPIDYSMASFVHSHLVQKGVDLYLGKSVSAFERDGDAIKVCFSSGERVTADMVILSIGVRPNNRLSVDAGLECGERGGIKVDEYLATSNKDIYAVGDVIEYPHPIDGKPWMNFLAGPANRQARIVADNMVFGNKVRYEGAVGTSVAKVFDMTVAATGFAAKTLRRMGVDYLSATIHPFSHAGYYPGATPMTIKVVFAPSDGKLLGAQVVGFDGVDKRIDEFALAIKRGATVYDLTALEQAYAPPYSSAKDPVAVAGYVSGNILSGKMKPIYWRELRDADLTAVSLIDVRTPEEFALGSIHGAVNIPVDEMRSRLGEIPAGRPVILYCGVGLRGYLASNILRQNGFDDVRNLIGGIKLYKSATKPVAQPRGFSSAARSVADKHSDSGMPVVKVDACGISCPGPILKMKQNVEALPTGRRIEIAATDPGFPRDAEAWCESTGNRFVGASSEAGVHKVVVEKGEGKPACSVQESGKGKTFILFSDDLDKALATFVLANGAAATGEKVTIFFTFWGLNAIKKERKSSVSKDMFGRMFSMMMPADSRFLKLSKMNMGGLGSRMMRHVMRRKNVDSLEQLREQAIRNGVEMIACQMSMDVMGVAREELLDGVTVGGVATYMNRADKANVNLFI